MTNIISPHAKIAANVTIGPFTMIGDEVEIDEGTTIGSHVVIEGPTRIGKHNQIGHYVVLGGAPQHKLYQGEKTYLEIGDHNIIREFCTMHRGSPEVRGSTKVGNHNWFMANTHVAHDCQVGNHNTFANYASLAGDVMVEDHVGLSGFAGVHQGCRIGAYSFIGAYCFVKQDVLPYMLAADHVARLHGINLIGLKRQGFNDELIGMLKNAYRIIFRKQLPLKDAVEELQTLYSSVTEIQKMVQFLNDSKRGVTRE